MAVRSINLKMILPKGGEGRPLRENIWLTHQTVNEAVAELERILLLCRGRGYATGEDELISAEQVQTEALKWAREVQRANGKPNAGDDAEVLTELGSLYEALVPSVLLDEKGTPLKGAAQDAGAFASPMMAAESSGFLRNFDKILDPLPAWVQQMREDSSDWKVESAAWLETEQAHALLHAQNRPLTWVLLSRRGEPWQEAFVKDQEKKRKEAEGVPSLVRKLKEDLGLLPLMRPPISSRFAGWKGGLTPWDRLALRLAAAHLLSWESWNHRARTEHAGVRGRVENQREAVERFGELIPRLREYESARHEELKRVTEATDERPFLITRRMLRAWDRVREAWLRPRCKTRNDRLTALADLQTKLLGRFGDADLFRWLAHEGREDLWRTEDPLPVLARLNALERLLQRKRERALCTPPDPRLHPRWMNYEPKGGSNLRNYDLLLDQGRVAVKLKLLSRAEDGLEENDFSISLAPSGQLETPAWNGGTKKARRLLFRSAYQDFAGALRGSEILLARRHLESREAAQLAAGDVGRVWFKLVLDVDSRAPDDWLDGRGRPITPAMVHHFNTGRAKTSRHTDALEPGLRVLSVDLGLRTFAACSVFELVAGQPKDVLAFPADEERDLWARHERSFALSLPGDTANAEVRAARGRAYDELGTIRRDLNHLRDLLRVLAKETPDERRAALDDICRNLTEAWFAGPSSSVSVVMLDSLGAVLELPQPRWEAEVTKRFREAETTLGERIHHWRQHTRPRAGTPEERHSRRAYLGGKSIWSVEYLTGVRRLLQGWSLHGRQARQINRADRERQGVFAAHLLDHINALKKDRVKAGSDLLVQAARGFVPHPVKGWVSRFEPCRLILLEDLARYRFHTDRPRRENSQLMRWSHRQIAAEVEMQAELYGIVTGTIGAGFSSRYHARTAAPGCRVRRLSAEDLESPGIRKRLDIFCKEVGTTIEALQPGIVVPWDGGQEFFTLGPNGLAVTLHADVNAAQNLQRRFWTRHADAYRISALEVRQDETTLWYPDRDGVRLRGALAGLVGHNGYARLVPAADGEGFCLEAITKAQWRRGTGSQAASGDEKDLGELEAELSEAAGEDLERGAGRQVFFRDPSGLVLRSDRWYEGKEFWGRVRRRIVATLGITKTKPTTGG